MHKSVTPDSAMGWHQKLTASVLPRPIAVIVTRSSVEEILNWDDIDEVRSNKALNVAPFSYNGVQSHIPPLVSFTVVTPRDGKVKTTLNNVLASGDFTQNYLESIHSNKINDSSGHYDKTRFTHTGLTPMKSEEIGTPGIAEAYAIMECELKEVRNMGAAQEVSTASDLDNVEPGTGIQVVGEIIRLAIEKRLLGEGDNMDFKELSTVARLGGSSYSRTDGNNIFDLERRM